MENSRTSVAQLTIGLSLICVSSLPHFAFAYARDTHKGLTEATAKAYEQTRGDIFSNTEQARMMQGSWDEDDNWRFMRHFFDPVNNRGLTLAGSEYISSKIWAQDTEGQGNYNCLNAWLCAGKHIGYSDAFFSSPTDFSWDRAVYEYTWGDKSLATETLGHILHLVQDATVPAHVRNDAHPSQAGIGDADTYELFSGQYADGPIIVPSGLVTPSFPGIAHALDAVAGFTNNNFVSKDTLFEQYTFPDKNQVKFDGEFLYNAFGTKIARAKGWVSFTGKVNITEVYIDDDKNTVVTDYWRVLSKKAIEAGVGVIDLFFREVEKEKRTGILKSRNVSAAELHAKETARKGFGIVKGLYGSSLNQGDVEDLLNDNAGQAGAAALAIPNNQPSRESVTQNPRTAAAVNNPSQAQPRNNPQVLGASISPMEEPTQELPRQDQTSSVPIPAEPQTSVPTSPANNSGDVSGGSPTPATVEIAPTPSLALTILTPLENDIFGTTSIAFTGTTSAPSVVTASFDSTQATTTTDGSGNWSFNFTLSSGTTTVSFSAATPTDATATSTRAVVIDTASPSAPVISISECSASFVTAHCVIATTTVTVAWSEVSGATYYKVTKDNATLATTTASTATSSVSGSATTTFAVVAYKLNGMAATSTEKAVFVTTQPLLISEIGWAGTNASAEDEWIELRNITNSTLDLSHFIITTPDESRIIQLSGTISPMGDTSAHDYFLVERNAEATTAVSPNALTANFAQLADGGEQLLLKWGNGIATTTIDVTPSVATCAGWCGGANAGSAGYSVQSGTSTAQFSMERKDSSPDGSLTASWQTADGYTLGAFDRTSSVIYGTPGAVNSKGNPRAGWFCSPDTTSITSDAHYTPPSSSCTYLMRAISTSANRYGDLYRGDVASSTLVRGHYFGKAYITENQSDPISNPVAGEHFFIAIYQARTGAAYTNYPTDDNTLFRNYFTTGANLPPHSNYFVIPWVYGP